LAVGPHRSLDRAELVGEVAVDPQRVDPVLGVEHVVLLERSGFERFEGRTAAGRRRPRNLVDHVVAVDLQHRRQVLAPRRFDVLAPGSVDRRAHRSVVGWRRTRRAR